MREVEVKFEREDQEGIHHCAVTVPVGAHLLSPETKAESEYFTKHGRRTNERLACQVKIDGPGEVVVMTKEKAKEPDAETTGEDKSEQYRKEFAEMPLEKKIANLVQLETIALGETVSFIINSPFKVADKVMDVMAEFGFKKEEKQKEAARPAEHKDHKQASASDHAPKKKKAPKSDSHK
jgi:hypothetical protein